MRAIGLLIIPLGLISGVAIRLVVPVQMQRADMREAQSRYDRHAMASVVGEVRSSLADYLWAKTDEYTHGGVWLRPMTAREKRLRTAREASSADELHHHEDETSVIPERARDPRWLWGDIERQVKPFFDVRHHFHRPVREVLPLYRFMTWADPTFVQGYLVGAQMILFDDKRHLHEALAFLQEGARHNPRSVALFTELGRYALVQLGDERQAERYLRRAIRNGDYWVQTGNAPILLQNPFERDGWRDAYRWLAILNHREQRDEQQRAWARRGLHYFPNDPVLQQFAK
jgi:tetratricopeptide (TPR) repeat protein